MRLLNEVVSDDIQDVGPGNINAADGATLEIAPDCIENVCPFRGTIVAGQRIKDRLGDRGVMRGHNLDANCPVAVAYHHGPTGGDRNQRAHRRIHRQRRNCGVDRE